jgi:hypothetical protein
MRIGAARVGLSHDGADRGGIGAGHSDGDKHTLNKTLKIRNGHGRQLVVGMGLILLAHRPALFSMKR